jgi:hypothetical protein
MKSRTCFAEMAIKRERRGIRTFLPVRRDLTGNEIESLSREGARTRFAETEIKRERRGPGFGDETAAPGPTTPARGK